MKGHYIAMNKTTHLNVGTKKIHKFDLGIFPFCLLVYFWVAYKIFIIL